MRYQINRIASKSCETCFTSTLERAWETCLTHSKVGVANPMRDRNITLSLVHQTDLQTPAGSDMLASQMKTGCPEPFFGGGGNEASVARVIVYMSRREALTEGIGEW
jgi:hypothetical protein